MKKSPGKRSDVVGYYELTLVSKPRTLADMQSQLRRSGHITEGQEARIRQILSEGPGIDQVSVQLCLKTFRVRVERAEEGVVSKAQADRIIQILDEEPVSRSTSVKRS